MLRNFNLNEYTRELLHKRDKKELKELVDKMQRKLYFAWHPSKRRLERRSSQRRQTSYSSDEEQKPFERKERENFAHLQNVVGDVKNFELLSNERMDSQMVLGLISGGQVKSLKRFSKKISVVVDTEKERAKSNEH